MKSLLCLLVASSLVLLAGTVAGQKALVQPPTPTYDEHLVQANALFKKEDLNGALLQVQAAAKLDPKRYEAPATAALILHRAKRPAEARAALEEALQLAPADKKEKVQAIAKVLGDPAAKPDSAGITPPPATEPAQLTGAARRQFNTLLLIVEEADKAASADERKKLLREFLDKSAAFVKEQPGQSPVWTLRAVAALELNQPKVGWEAGQQLVKLGADNSSDAKVQKVLAMLDRKGWLGEKVPEVLASATAERPLVNSLGMKFVPVPGTKVLASIWETRVGDFTAFVAATGYDATEGMFSFGEGGWKQRGHTWKKPGFDQTPDHPVCGVNWGDANKFCEWLTKTEREAGLIGRDDEYRLPTDQEWSSLVGSDKYPWGNDWPPRTGAGNYADAGSDLSSKIENYRDGYNRTAPVGSFNPNRIGLYDLGGNVWEWCWDWYRKDLNSEELRKEIPALNDDGEGAKYRVLRGASWFNDGAVYLSSSCRHWSNPGGRYDYYGFRCVLVVGGGVR